jgi:hypothetical protein
MSNFEKRMYGFVPYNLSDIQKGIQFGHAVVEYFLNSRNSYEKRQNYFDWAENHKTFIILNGGTTNNSITTPGTLNNLLDEFKSKFPEMSIGEFYEPDLGNQLTAFCFIVDERVFKPELYPEGSKLHDVGGASHIELRHILEKYKLA